MDWFVVTTSALTEKPLDDESRVPSRSSMTSSWSLASVNETRYSLAASVPTIVSYPAGMVLYSLASVSLPGLSPAGGVTVTLTTIGEPSSTS